MATILQNHYVLAVHDLDVMSTFFQQLGFREQSRPPGWVFVVKDNCMVMMGLCMDAIPAAELGDHNYFGYLRVDDARSYFQDILHSGVDILFPIADKPWQMREFGVRSPEGHRIMIGQYIGQ
ncbi:VOC family protein [Arsenicibacter rosenii]|uniref:Glyoxalase/fosfomycin resistance/dioxygenase domain-containing protein n=1 Tax=Arsenicibacter rosenii TaxID=1750698 RepID=A0A1S2VAP9_9BACT|nr:VOC family protein [Arsenicibacter rosenii]OIN55791.1 hypothetical protein BLX24_28110 [Arsenicibacter rosenii]